MVHGRGATAESILELRHELESPELAYVAPQAAGYAWYPYSFMAPMEKNEPGLSSGARPARKRCWPDLEAAGIPPGAHDPPRLLAGGLPVAGIRRPERPALRRGRRALRRPDRPARNPPRTIRARSPARRSSSAAATAIRTSRASGWTSRRRCCGGMGAEVTERIYPAMGHTVNEDEMEFVRGMVAAVS